MTINIKGLPRIPPQEVTPTLRLLLAFIEQQQQTIEQLQQQVQAQQTEIEALKAEVARLQKRPAKPQIRPSTLPKDDEATDDDDNDDAGQGGGAGTTGKTTSSRKRKKKLIIHKTKIIKPDNLPAGSRLLGYEDFTIQDLLIQPCNTRYRVARFDFQAGNPIRRLLLHRHHHQLSHRVSQQRRRSRYIDACSADRFQTNAAIGQRRHSGHP